MARGNTWKHEHISDTKENIQMYLSKVFKDYISSKQLNGYGCIDDKLDVSGRWIASLLSVKSKAGVENWAPVEKIRNIVTPFIFALKKSATMLMRNPWHMISRKVDSGFLKHYSNEVLQAGTFIEVSHYVCEFSATLLHLHLCMNRAGGREVFHKAAMGG